ncbi:MAG TPA: hypothetical protein VKW08_27295 [Xanthobacteraceae bacterium]|nr:hypothetical protein [Xanthobacteraceae bacterium]
MGLFRRSVPQHYVEIHPDNLHSRDWIILLEAGTIVGNPDQRLRVALATTERKVVTKYNILLRKKHFLVLDGYDPRIHALYFCPQLYRLDSDNTPVALSGEEIGKLVAQSIRDGIREKAPWYGPSDGLPKDPIVAPGSKPTFDTLVVKD